MAGVKGKSGPPGNANAFRHGLAAISKTRDETVLDERGSTIKAEILAGLIDDKGGEGQISTAQRQLAELIGGDAALLVVMDRAIHDVLSKNAKAKANPKALAQLDGYRRPIVNSLASNLQKFGFEKVTKTELGGGAG